MKKMFVIITIFFFIFFSFVTVPMSYATGYQSILGRIAFRAIAPSVVNAIGVGSGAIIGVGLGLGIGYIILKSGAIDVLQDWWNNNMAYPVPSGSTSPVTGYLLNGTFYSMSKYQPEYYGGLYHCGAVVSWGSSNYTMAPGSGFSTAALAFSDAMVRARTYLDANNWFGYGTMGHWPGNGSYPTVPGDYGTQLDGTSPVFSPGSVYATPGTMAAVVGSGPIVSVQTGVSDADLDKFIVGTGSTVVDVAAGTQEGSPPATTDNTVTAGDTATIGLLQQMINYLSNLIGIKTSVDSVQATLDNSLSVQSQMSAKLDNVGVFPQSGLNALDNIVSIEGLQSQKLDNIATGVNAIPAKLDNVINVINTSAASVSTVQTRVQSLRDIAAVKFPFSLVSSIGVNAVSGSSTYAFADLPLTASISIPISPMAGPLATLFSWIRQLLVWFFWVGTLFAILKKGMEM